MSSLRPKLEAISIPVSGIERANLADHLNSNRYLWADEASSMKGGEVKAHNLQIHDAGIV